MSATVICCSLLFGVACSRISVSDDDRKSGRATSGMGTDPSFSLPDPRDQGAWYLGEGLYKKWSSREGGLPNLNLSSSLLKLPHPLRTRLTCPPPDRPPASLAHAALPKHHKNCGPSRCRHLQFQSSVHPGNPDNFSFDYWVAHNKDNCMLSINCYHYWWRYCRQTGKGVNKLWLHWVL